MNPRNSSQGGDELGPVGSSTPQNAQPHANQAAAVNIIRNQIDALYNGRPIAIPERKSTIPSRGTITESAHESAQPAQEPTTTHREPQADQWETYHSAWQSYYQQYYDGYYRQKHAEEAAAEALKKQSDPVQAAQQPAHPGYFSEQPTEEPKVGSKADQPEDDFSKDQALYELREKLLGKVRDHASKVRRSKHFVPIVAALSVVLIFVFLQYNRVFIAAVNAYVSPGSVDPQNIVIDPTEGTAVGSDPRLIIPKINVDVPVIYGIGADHDSQMAAMEKGVAHFSIPGASSKPGEKGNTALSGHSSNDLFEPGEYKFIFAQLEKLQNGDTIYANYNGVRYTYVITKKEVVLPTQVDKLVYPTDKPVLTLITCTPLGTTEKRLLVTAEQISPDPSGAAAAPASNTSEDGSSDGIPGSSPTLLERLFGAR
jgi:sortase A